MTHRLAAADVERFRTTVAKTLGLRFDDDKLDFLADVLRRRLDASREVPAVYLGQLEAAVRDELRELARELTVGETYFFRHLEQFRAFSGVALPDLVAARSHVRQLRLLSAACSSGEEPYSLAMLVREHPLLSGWDVSIRAVDVNAAVLEKAARAQYSSWSLRETPADARRRWFVDDGGALSPAREVRALVRFEERNLAVDDADLWPPGGYDVVFCRNMIMYLTPESARSLVARIERALAPGGYLFLGHAETLRGLSQSFHLRHSNEAFYYQRREGGAELAPIVARPMTPVASGVTADLGMTTSWIEAVQRASERIRALADAPRPESARGAGAGLAAALELLEKERFAEALEHLPSHEARDPDALLVRAVLLTHAGELAVAEQACAELLQLDELNAGAHYVLALCRESAGDRQGAREHDQVAIYLDPTFAMPRLHLGLMARRAGEREAAQRELDHAQLLLAREDASRLLLFGGGFRREALIALCRVERSLSGGKP